MENEKMNEIFFFRIKKKRKKEKEKERKMATQEKYQGR